MTSLSASLCPEKDEKCKENAGMIILFYLKSLTVLIGIALAKS